jgi:hypothetical protein
MPAVKNVGEPCAGEPHARFEVAAGGNQASRASTCRAAGRLSPTLLTGTRWLSAPMLDAYHTVDTATIALWLGHESEQTTQIYLHADLTVKQRAIDRTTPPGTKPGRYRPTDPLLAFLEDL